MLGISSANNPPVLELKPIIFKILANSDSQEKRYFKIPEQYKKTETFPLKMNELVDNFLALGLKVP